MLDGVKISRRQSEIRQALAELARKDQPTEDETRSMETLDGEYRTNETRFRAALTAEDGERREAGAELETRDGKAWADLIAGFELRQIAAFYDEGRAFSGQTAEVIAEMRSRGSYRGTPVPLAALETRVGETIASGTPNPVTTMPIVDRLFPASVAARMGVLTINIDAGEREYPVVSSAIAAGWAATETGNVAGPTVFSTVDKALAPDSTFGVQLRVTRKAMKQSGAGLEAAMRRDMQGAIEVGLDAIVFLGSGAAGQPLGIIPGAVTYGITVTDISAAASYTVLKAAAVRFMLSNAAASPADVRLLMRPEIWSALDDGIWDAGSGISEYDKVGRAFGAVVLSTNALAAPAGVPAESSAVLTTTAGGRAWPEAAGKHRLAGLPLARRGGRGNSPAARARLQPPARQHPGGQPAPRGRRRRAHVRGRAHHGHGRLDHRARRAGDDTRAPRHRRISGLHRGARRR